MKKIFKKTLKFISSRLIYLIIGIFLAISVTYVYAAWTAPVSNPPEGNIAAPINIGTTGQSKQGGLILNTDDSVNGLIVQFGNVGIGTTDPGAKFSFNNLNDGTDGADGITWYNPAPTSYGIYRTAGSWASPNYQQLRLAWDTGIILYPGTAYGKSYVDIQGAGLRVTSGNVGIGTTNPGAKLEVVGNVIANTPTAGNHLTTKEYVDNAVAAAGGGAYIVTTSGWDKTYGWNSPWCPTGWTAVQTKYRITQIFNPHEAPFYIGDMMWGQTLCKKD